MADTVDYTIAANTLGLTEGDAGAMKALTAATTARDSSTGTPFVMPGERGGTANIPTWTIDADSMDAWTAANASPGATHNWWVAARAVSEAVAAWHTEWTSSGANFDAAA